MKFQLTDTNLWAAVPDVVPAIPSAAASNIGLAEHLWPEVLQAADWLGLGIVVVCGCFWMFGNRTVAMQRIIDMAIGYEVIRHGLTILSWLREV